MPFTIQNTFFEIFFKIFFIIENTLYLLKQNKTHGKTKTGAKEDARGSKDRNGSGLRYRVRKKSHSKKVWISHFSR